MSYIEINLGGKNRGLKFNQYAVVTMAQYLDFDNVPATYGYALVYAGLKGNCYVKREEPDFKFEDVCDWVDQLPFEEVSKIRDCFEETQMFKNMLESQSEPMTKKKQKSSKEKP